MTGFIFYEARLERLGGQPIIEPGLFKNSIFSVSTIISVIFGMALFGSSSSSRFLCRESLERLPRVVDHFDTVDVNVNRG